jgi:chromosome segregation ATPase
MLERAVVSWWQIIQTLWPIAATMTPLILLGGFAWLQTKFPSRADLKEHETELRDLTDQVSGLVTRITTNENRIDNVVRDLEREPTRASLANSISDIRDRLGSVESSVRAMQHQLETQNDYLHTLVQQGLGKS